MLVEEICQRDVVTIAPEATLRDAARSMRRNHVGDVVVIDSRRQPLGIVTDRDLVVEVLAKELEPERVAVGDLTVGELHVVGLKVSALAALETMSRHGVHRLPVVDASGELAGIVSSDDILELISRFLAILSELAPRGRSLEGRVRS